LGFAVLQVKQGVFFSGLGGFNSVLQAENRVIIGFCSFAG